MVQSRFQNLRVMSRSDWRNKFCGRKVIGDVEDLRCSSRRDVERQMLQMDFQTERKSSWAMVSADVFTHASPFLLCVLKREILKGYFSFTAN